MSEKTSTIYILYNAKASLLGKLTYGYKKLSASAEKSPCSACDLTHGGLRLEESAEWKSTKQKIPATVKQLHQDELTPELLEFVKTQNLKYPVVLGQESNGPFKLLVNAEDLSRVFKEHSSFLSLLSRRAKENSISLGKETSL